MIRLYFLLTLAAAPSAFAAKEEVPIIILPTRDPRDPGPKPKPNQKGTYDPILKSIATGQVTEIKPKLIFRWGTPKEEVWQGFTYWAIELEYRTEVVFGKAEATARALIRQNHVHRWLYVGSNEVVP